MEKTLLTIKEVAEKVGVSQQAIYKQLNNKLNNYVEIVENKKMLNFKVLEEVYNIKVEQPIQPNVQPNIEQLYKEQIDILKEQIDSLKEQINQKDKEIERLHQEIERLHQEFNKALQIFDQQKLQLLTYQKPGEEQEEKKQSIFSRLFKK